MQTTDAAGPARPNTQPGAVSIVVPHHGDPTPTLTLIDELRPQLRDADRIIVSDDCSPTHFPATNGVTVVRREVNGGFGANCNSGADAASGDLLLFLNSDLHVDRSFLADLLDAAAPWQPCVAGPRLIESGGVGPSARHFPLARHQVIEWLTPLARVRPHRWAHEAVGHDARAFGATAPLATDWLVGAVMLIPRADFEAVGGFDERFHMNSEEVDLQRRLRARGLPSMYLPAVVVRHEGGGSSDPAKRRGWLVDSRWTYTQKWGGVRRLKAGLVAATLVNLGWNLGRRALGRDVHPLASAREELSLIHGPDIRYR